MEIIQLLTNPIQNNQLQRNIDMFADPFTYACMSAALERVKNMDIAIEIALTNIYFNGVYQYAQVMNKNNTPDGLISKDSLLKWLDDRVVKGEVKRKGIISLYLEERQDHFNEYKWNARNFFKFVEFARGKLTNVEYVGKKNKAIEFLNSFMNEKCFHMIVQLMTIKLFYKLHTEDMFISHVAPSVVDKMNAHKDIMSQMGKIAGAVGKHRDNNDLVKFLMGKMRDEVQGYLSQEIDRDKVAYIHKEEFEIYNQYKPQFQSKYTETLSLLQQNYDMDYNSIQTNGKINVMLQ
jgi:hypothetical protein